MSQAELTRRDAEERYALLKALARELLKVGIRALPVQRLTVKLGEISPPLPVKATQPYLLVECQQKKELWVVIIGEKVLFYAWEEKAGPNIHHVSDLKRTAKHIAHIVSS